MARPDQDTTTNKPSMVDKVKDKVHDMFSGDSKGNTGSTQDKPSMMDQVKEKVQHVMGGEDRYDHGHTGTTKASTQEKLSTGAGATPYDKNTPTKKL
jgi:hypothetical protein